MGLRAIAPFVNYSSYTIGSIRTLGAYQSTWCKFYWPTTYILESAGWEKVGKLWQSPYTRNLQCLRVALEIEKREALTKY